MTIVIPTWLLWLVGGAVAVWALTFMVLGGCIVYTLWRK